MNDDQKADLQQRVTADVSSMHRLNDQVRALSQQVEQRKLRGQAEAELQAEIEVRITTAHVYTLLWICCCCCGGGGGGSSYGFDCRTDIVIMSSM